MVPADQCRLVKYDEYNKLIEMSYDGEEVGAVASYTFFALVGLVVAVFIWR